MAKNMTEDAVRDLARDILGLTDNNTARAGVGQLTTFNQLGFAGVADKKKKITGCLRPVDRFALLVNNKCVVKGIIK